MKHIEKYNKFIKLNDDLQINVDVNEYDLNIVKDSLIEIEDLGFKIEYIRFDIYETEIFIRLSNDTSKITETISCEYKFNKTKIYKKTEIMLYKGVYYTYKLNEYEKTVINTIKDRSILMLNMLDYNKGEFSLKYNMFTETSNIIISLYKK